MNLAKLLKSFGFSNRLSSAKTARERLQIVLSHERLEGGDENFLPKLRHELITVIQKYFGAGAEVDVELQRTGTCSTLKLNFTSPQMEESV